MYIMMWPEFFQLFSTSFIPFLTLLLASLAFNVRFSTRFELDFPILYGSLSYFTFFFSIATIYFFAFDLSVFDHFLFFNQNIQLIFLFIMLAIILVSRDYNMNRFILKSEYDFLLICVVLSAICLCYVDDFLVFYLVIELQSLTFYVLACFNRHSEFSTESGLKYFIFGGVISCFLLFGICILYLTFGSTSFELIFSLLLLTNNAFYNVGVVFVLFALLFKIGSAPFHAWVCDVYDGVLLSVTLLFSAVPKLIIFSVIIKLFFAFSNLTPFLTNLLVFSSILSIAIGTLSAFYQKRLKRLFAYSAIAHTGFILLGFLSCSIESSKSIIIYLIIYALLTVLLFSLIIFSALSTTNFPTYIANFSSFGINNYFFALVFSLTLFSIAGIPPLAGFFSKFFVLLSAISGKFLVTSIVVVLISSAACFYYIRLIKIFFFVNDRKNNLWISNTNQKTIEFIIGIFTFFNLVFFLQPELFSNITTVLCFCLI